MTANGQDRRKLAAILALDVVGYSRMMSADESGTAVLVRTLRDDVLMPLLREHHGRIVKLMGDGAICEFRSVVDAVNCAIDIQSQMHARNRDQAQERQIILRMGINLGDVLLDGDDLLGDGVNVAARLEAIADPGAIFVSRQVARMAQGKVAAGFLDQGIKRLKNIKEPVQVFRVDPGSTSGPVRDAPRRKKHYAVALAFVALLAVGLGGWAFWADKALPEIDASDVLTVKGPAIAALPFANLSGGAENDAFAKALTEQLAGALTRFEGLRVLSRRASAKYADDLEALRRELGADYLLEGGVRRTEDRVRVTALLTSVSTGDQIWSRDFEAEFTPSNVMDVQDRLAGQVASAVASGQNSAINLDQLSATRGKTTDDMTVFNCVFSELSWASPSDMHKAYECTLKAVEADPDYVYALTRLSLLYSYDNIFLYGFRDDPGYDPGELALELAQKSLRLAPESADAAKVLAYAYFGLGEMERFREALSVFLAINPNDAFEIAQLGMRLAFSGSWDEGTALIEKAVAFNPSVVAPPAYYATAKRYYVREEYEEALAELKKAYFPGSFLDALMRTYFNAGWGKIDEARKAAEDLLEIRPDFVIQDAVEFYRRWQFEESYITKMVADLREAGLPERTAQDQGTRE